MLKIKLLQVNHNDRDDKKQPEFPDFSPCLAVKKVTIDAINYKDDGEHCTLDQSKLTVAVLDNDQLKGQLLGSSAVPAKRRAK